jgi:vacuolar-type H+-ATPase subunit E/Vma4
MPSLVELKDMAKKQNIKGWYKMNKEQLLEVLNIKEEDKYYVFTQKDLDEFLKKCRVVKN